MTHDKPEIQPKRVALAALVGGAVAAGSNVGLFLLLRTLGVDFVIQPGPAAPAAAITIPSFIGASFFPAFIAGGLPMLLGRFTTKARGVFAVIACAFALVSLAGPLTVGGATTGTRLALSVMHLLTAAVIAGALWRRGPMKLATMPASVGR